MEIPSRNALEALACQPRAEWVQAKHMAGRAWLLVEEQSSKITIRARGCNTARMGLDPAYLKRSRWAVSDCQRFRFGMPSLQWMLLTALTVIHPGTQGPACIQQANITGTPPKFISVFTPSWLLGLGAHGPAPRFDPCPRARERLH